MMKSGRSYRGEDPEARLHTRRQKLLEAGLERFGTDGYASTTVKHICETAGLTERYFYESFSGKDDLLGAIYDYTIDLILKDVSAAMTASAPGPDAKARAGLGAFMEAIATDPRKVRIHTQLIEVSGANAALGAHYERAARLFAGLVQSAAEVIAPGAIERSGKDGNLVAMALIGATIQMARAWSTGETKVSLETLIDHCTAIYTAVARDVLGIAAAPEPKRPARKP